MPVQFIKGDLFTSDAPAFAHGCNAAGGMDAGVAVAFKKKWPRMFEEYKARCDDKRFHLGDVFVWNEGDLTIYNLAIQEHWKKKATLAALSRSMKKTVELAAQAGISKIALPRIGAGLGGLEWPRVKSVLTEVAGEGSVELIVYEQFIRDRTAPNEG